MPAAVVLVQHGSKTRDESEPGLTRAGRRQVVAVAESLVPWRPTRLVSSPRLRARQSIGPLAEATGLEPLIDQRVRERMEYSPASWATVADFLADWNRATTDRDFVPSGGDSSHAAGARLADAVLDHAAQAPLTVVATHGGVTVDLLRDLLGDDALDDRFLAEGMPNGCLTTLVVDGHSISVAGVGVEPGDWAAP